MIPWVQIYSNLPTHPKTYRLVELLGIKSSLADPNTVAVGMLVCLWTWASQNAYDGDLSCCTDAAIADACRWKRSPNILVDALKKSGFLDADMSLHDWDEYSQLLIEKIDNDKVKTRERVRRYRERNRNERNG